MTRRNIFEALIRERLCWHGRLDEVEFLGRIFPLKKLPSTDERKEFSHARDDIWQHRVRNCDWEDDWIFFDGRFGLLNGGDDLFLKFLAEMLHPVVRPNADEVTKLVETFNDHLRADGFELIQQETISGRPVFGARAITAVGAGIGQSADHAGQEVCSASEPLFYTPEEVADVLRVDISIVMGYLATGELRGVTIGTECRILGHEVFRFLEETMRHQQLELLKTQLKDPRTWGRELKKHPEILKEIENSTSEKGTFAAFLKEGLKALKEEEQAAGTSVTISATTGLPDTFSLASQPPPAKPEA